MKHTRSILLASIGLALAGGIGRRILAERTSAPRQSEAAAASRSIESAPPERATPIEEPSARSHEGVRVNAPGVESPAALPPGVITPEQHVAPDPAPPPQPARPVLGVVVPGPARRAVDEILDQPFDDHWATLHERMIRAELERLGENHYTVDQLFCRSAACVGTLTWSDYESARASMQQQLTLPLDCVGTVVDDGIPTNSQSYATAVIVRCGG